MSKDWRDFENDEPVSKLEIVLASIVVAIAPIMWLRAWLW